LIREKEVVVSTSDKYMRRFESQASEGDVARIGRDLGPMNRGPVAKVWDKVQRLWALIKDPNAGWGSKALAIAALIYLISPLDAIPDLIPVLGLTDDAGVIIAAAAKLASDLRKY
jgi:hypothetical protein